MQDALLGQQRVKAEHAKNKGKNAAPAGNSAALSAAAPVDAPRSQRHRAVLRNLPPAYEWRTLRDEMRKIGDIIYSDIDVNGHGIVEFASREARARRGRFRDVS
mmetsp:Transcript_27811/g.87289  ORF Transcript_27811/g.87289 Transcript_27811/m.87289 type:complete len:104 (-) Transcript_27811:107-418(-)